MDTNWYGIDVDRHVMNTATGCVVAVSQDLNVSTTFVPGEHWDLTAQVFVKIDTAPDLVTAISPQAYDSKITIDLKIVRAELLAYLEQPGHTQVVLAEESGVSQSVISRISSGAAKRLTPETVSRLAPIIGFGMTDSISVGSAPIPKQDSQGTANDERLYRVLYFLTNEEKNMLLDVLRSYDIAADEHGDLDRIGTFVHRFINVIASRATG